MAKCIEGVARLRPSKSFRSVFRHTRNNFARSSREVPRRSFLSIFARGGSKRSPPPSSSRGSFLTGFHMRVDGNILIAPHAGRANFHQGIRNYAGGMGSTSLPSTHSPFYVISNETRIIRKRRFVIAFHKGQADDVGSIARGSFARRKKIG